jgi:hypothetical protein
MSPLKGLVRLLAYPGLTPWAKLFRPFGALSSQLSTLSHRPDSKSLWLTATANDQRLATNDLFVFLAKRLNLDIHACRQIELHQRIHSLLRGLENIEQTLVGTNLELLA